MDPGQSGLVTPLPSVSTPHRHRNLQTNGHLRSEISTPPSVSRMSMSRDNINSEVFTAIYSGVPVLEMTCRGVSVMRRRSDSALNATQILKVAGIQKGNRTKILEREILTGPHEKVQGGYGKYQGTWISYEIGLALCDRHSVREVLAPLLELDTSSAPAMHATPTKEQHQASVRRHQNQANLANGRSLLEGDRHPIYNAQQSRDSSTAARSVYQSKKERSSEGAFASSSREAQGSTHDLARPSNGHVPGDGQPESAATRNKGSFDSRIGISNLIQDTLPPLHSRTAKDFDRSRETMTNIFLESDHGRLLQVLLESSSDSDLDIDVPIDELGHTALHWAAALARLPLVQALVERGASPHRGNSTGETALMRAVMATNTMDQNLFLEMLDLLGSSVAAKDSSKRTVLHHIAITAGIKGRSAASRYYLTSLLEWVVNNDSPKGLQIEAFGAAVVDAQDRNGDTALNIAARIGSRGIVQSLLEVNADPFIPNRAGIRPVDSGTVDERMYVVSEENKVMQPQRVEWNNSEIVKASGDVVGEITGLISSLQQEFEQEMAAKCQVVDATNMKLREASKALADLRREVELSKTQIAKLDEINQRIRNTKNAIQMETEEYNQAQAGLAPPQFGALEDADALFSISADKADSIPKHIIQARVNAYKQDLDMLDLLAVQLNDKSSAMEQRCRKLVSLCTNSPIEQVDETLPALLAALQSDGDPREFDLNEANRVAGFLKILS